MPGNDWTTLFHLVSRLITSWAVYILQGCWQILSPTKKKTSYSDRRFWVSYILFIIIIGGILVLYTRIYIYIYIYIYTYIYTYIYVYRLVSNEIFSPSNKIHREVGRAKDVSAPRYFGDIVLQCRKTRKMYGF